MENEYNKWDIRFLKLAKHISEWSKDPSTKCGAVITDDKRIVSVGFNGFPRYVNDDISFYNDRDEKLRRVQHAERNAILFARCDITACDIFIYPMPPCSQCAGAIIQSGIERVITIKSTQEQEERWKEDFDTMEEMFMEAEVDLIYVPLEILS